MSNSDEERKTSERTKKVFEIGEVITTKVYKVAPEEKERLDRLAKERIEKAREKAIPEIRERYEQRIRERRGTSSES